MLKQANKQTNKTTGITDIEHSHYPRAERESTHRRAHHPHAWLRSRLWRGHVHDSLDGREVTGVSHGLNLLEIHPPTLGRNPSSRALGKATHGKVPSMEGRNSAMKLPELPEWVQENYWLLGAADHWTLQGPSARELTGDTGARCWNSCLHFKC